MAALLELRNFRYSYGNIPVVKGIDLHVNEGEIVTIIGANGAGKTTTMQSISGLLPISGIQGEILFDGIPVQRKKGYEIAKMGLVQVLEGRHIFSQLSVLENLQLGAYTRKDRRRIAEEIKKIYRLFPRLEERKNQSGGTLSGGEQQMLAIARAWLSNPRMLLLDEPSLGLAPIIVQEIFEAVRQIADNGTTVLFVEQNSKIALSFADRGYVMQTGKVMMQDVCENLLKNDDVKKAYLGGH